MIIVKFQGGLGNQMFQYAFLLALKKIYPDTEVLADLSIYKKCAFHYGYELERVFGIEVEEAPQDAIKELSTTRYYRECEDENRYDVDLHRFLRSDDWYLEGFWQNERYFHSIFNELRGKFLFSNQDIQSLNSIILEMKGRNSVSVHVRRGDYVGTPFDCLPVNYYEKAFEYIESHISEPIYYFFSDDVQYVTKRFEAINNKVIVSDNSGYNSYKDMILMSCCYHNIIANSSFSFWGAWLNHNQNKIVVSPSLFTVGRAPVAAQDWVKR